MTTTYSGDLYDPYARAAQEDRCAPRVALKLPATLGPSGAQGFQVFVTDLSLAGFSCEAVTGMRPGALCWITLPGLSGLQAEVAWNHGARVGCAFANLLSQAVLDNLFTRYG
jgi:hypothetical protein